MENSSHGPASFFTQANALLRKNIIFQKRNMKTNVRLIAFPFLLCLLLLLMQNLINHELDKPKNRCGCTCIDRDGDGVCENVCGIEYSTLDQVATCPIPSPPEWPAFVQVPRPEYRAVRTDVSPFTDLPDESCRRTQTCPVAILLTGGNRSLAERLAENLFKSDFSPNFSDYITALSNAIPGTDTVTETINYIEPAFLSGRPIYIFQPQCMSNFSLSIPIKIGTSTLQQDVKCVQGIHSWRDSESVINNELFKGFREGNPERKINEVIAAYDLLNSNENIFNLSIWYNSTLRNHTASGPIGLVRVPRSLNMASNAYLQFFQGSGVKMQVDFVKEMPKPGTRVRLDFSSLLGGLFFTWVILQLFPVILISLVYEKQRNLRIMMKMHGLGDGPYWTISYAYFLLISSLYVLCFVIFGSLIGLKFFTLNDYSIQFVFYFIYINLQIALAFLLSTVFSDIKTATVLGYISVFGSGLLGAFLFQFFVEDTSFPRGWLLVMEIFPGFSLFRGLYEFAQYSFTGNFMGTDGMRWRDLNDKHNGMRDVLIIMFVEWLVLLPFAFYLDQVASLGSGIRKHPLFFFRCFRKKPLPTFREPSLQRQGSKVFVEMEKPDVAQEREVVNQLLLEPSTSHAIICNNLKKVYPGRDGNPEKFAVRGLSLALPRGECFGMLGPNGAGKTSFINMMIGLITPTSGTAFVQGLDIRTDMDKIYTNMGVCPQHDLLWETLTGREHLLFYGRLKNLKGSALTNAVEESLKSVNLFHGGVGDRQSGKYSGGMKRRLSVAISLIGDPKVVYMDEPSTGLDPASRNNLWNVVKQAKQDRAIILTTHSMEEAEVLCDRLGIFVDGSLQCVGNPKELKGRYGGSYVFTMTTSSNQEEEVANLVLRLSPNANRIYHISGTQKFELPKQEVRIADVFQAVENAKRKFTIHAWGLADTTLEDVFIKVARGAQSFNVLS
ncbi:ABC transporter A family member 7 [Magnolia sinica]|uniref:ABC transporter A family member 7 n=1 Tax=Magnolia sinica TaxID=86752 RepID=UPI0026595E28|nr:ABC transporter A family member 7 [Magnolia sinica]